MMGIQLLKLIQCPWKDHTETDDRVRQDVLSLAPFGTVLDGVIRSKGIKCEIIRKSVPIIAYADDEP